MVERDLQAYLFSHPEALFPGETIIQKDREFWLEGRRIDLLFRTNDSRYIVELKAVPLTREHIGQVVEYYGLMRRSLKDEQVKMLLVAPSIPEFRRIFLEEIGIRCVEMPGIPSEGVELERLRSAAAASRKRLRPVMKESAAFGPPDSVHYEDLVTPVTRRSLAISHLFLRDSLAEIRTAFPEYEVLPIKMTRADSPDIICPNLPASLDLEPSFIGPYAWWAYGFGSSDEMPKNDVPNISVMAMPWGLDLAVNAELRTSQAVMKRRISEELGVFDHILAEHGNLQLQVLLKLEHQPRFYHWIPLVGCTPGTWDGRRLVEIVETASADYQVLRESWICLIERSRKELSRAQALHMRAQNRQPNLALRVVRQFCRNDPFWSMRYTKQREILSAEYCRLKPFIDLLR